MLQLIKVPESEPKRDRDSTEEFGPLVRAIQIGLMVYLSPVLLLVSSIGVASLAFRAVTRLVRPPRPIGVVSVRRPGDRDGRDPGSVRSRWISTAH